MKIHILLQFVLLFSVLALKGQDFPYGAVPLNHLTMTNYEGDSSASAVVLQEFGEAFIRNEDYHLTYKYHVRIKILKKNGLDQANIEIPLRKQDNNRYEKIVSIKASAFNLENDRIHETVLQQKDIFTEDQNKYRNVRKFAIPNVRVGSVIELSYTMDSPFVFNFRTWEFQSALPKMESEFWASVPGVYLYNITLRGFLKLLKNESKIVKNCLSWGGASADCAVMQFGMKNIPAFVEEDYMTAKKNFLSGIHFELSEIRHFDGRIDRVTKEWKDAEDELKRDSQFGVQLRRGKDIGAEVEKLVANETDQLTRAKAVFNFIQEWFIWNDTYGKYSEFGIKKAFDERKGNVGDINLSLVAAMRFAGLDAEPVILSTRANGLPIELHPVLSDFNYVVAKVNIGDQVYLADATEKYYPFGLLPERCLNGKGRVMGDRTSYWIDLKPAATGKTFFMLSLVLGIDGVMRGTVLSTYMGYDAVSERQKILSFQSVEEYIDDLRTNLGQMEITGYEVNDVDDHEKSISCKLEVELRAFDNMDAAHFLFNPFLIDKWSENPFKASERLYPVDFGVPMERIIVFNLEYPEGLEMVNLPEKVGLSLPNSGGRFLFEAQNTGNRLSLSNSLSIQKSVYSSTEYHYLKELFDRILQVQNVQLIFKKKT